MASYPAPTEALPVFAPAVFNTNDVPLTIEEGSKFFITYPAAQGAITIPTLSTGTLNVSGVITTTSSTTNIGLGYEALSSNTTGTANTAFGHQSGRVNDIGIRNTFIGDKAGLLTAGSRNQITCVGASAGSGTILGSNTTAVGYNTLPLSTGSSNTALGESAGASITTGTNNTCIGAGANITGAATEYSTAIGAGAVASTNNTIVLGTINDTIRYNKVSPLYTTPSFTNANIGWIENAAITYPGLTTNIIASNISANGTWIVYAFLNFTGLTNSPQLIVQDATPTQLGVIATRDSLGTDRYRGSFPYTITAAANVVSIRLSVAPTTGGINGGDAGQYVRFVRIA